MSVCGNKNFRSFGSCDLDLDLMIFMYELDPYSLWPWPWPDDLRVRTWPVFPGGILHVRIWTYVKAFESYRLTDNRDKHTDRQTDTTKIVYHAPSRVVKTRFCGLHFCCRQYGSKLNSFDVVASQIYRIHWNNAIKPPLPVQSHHQGPSFW